MTPAPTSPTRIGDSYQIDPLAARTPAAVQTPPGWPWVSLQMAAVIWLAAPSMSLATVLDGSCMAAATWAQVIPASAVGAYCAPGTRYWLPMSTNGNEPPAYRLNSACSWAVGCWK